MKFNFLLSTSILVVSTLSFNAYATLEHTVSIGYAKSKLKVDEDLINDNLKGINLKYNHEVANDWGVISSFSYAKNKNDGYDHWGYAGTSKISYYSLTAGPSYRLNNYVSAYGLIGFGYFHEDFHYYDEREKENKISMAYGLGVQVNPITNLAIDVSYEYSKLYDIDFTTWVVGIGYRF
ncbi:Ail/Lom family outer membrane beta-barrel protein [Proteus mirabilis]|uniref:Ail/Lom family outer membrane beta-barrel protein n=1 Tax=Proteus mirabilis TaxID=584 RepID=UPI0021D7C8F6|nr:Ail/Lom family outer membrane beta-barrel protein [Proteus mirabilis]MCU9586022.1 Ail/Lom family outer membrane beta-barrel protein [Proteus mirabilis]